MKAIRKNLVRLGASALLLTAALPMQADDATKRAKIEELFVVTRQQETLQQQMSVSSSEVDRMIPTMFTREQINTLQKKDHDALMHEVVVIMQQSSDWSAIKAKYVDAYAATYSESTVDGMLAFYRSDVGQNVVSKRTLLAENMREVKKTVLMNALPKIQAAFEQYRNAHKAQSSLPIPNKSK